MYWCISSASFSVMGNVSSICFFSSSKGLRQEDPLSPTYLLSVWRPSQDPLIELLRWFFLLGFTSGARGRRGSCFLICW